MGTVKLKVSLLPRNWWLKDTDHNGIQFLISYLATCYIYSESVFLVSTFTN